MILGHQRELPTTNSKKWEMSVTWWVRPVCGMQQTMLLMPSVLSLWNLVYASLPFNSFSSSSVVGPRWSVALISPPTLLPGALTYQFHQVYGFRMISWPPSPGVTSLSILWYWQITKGKKIQQCIISISTHMVYRDFNWLAWKNFHLDLALTSKISIHKVSNYNF